jgi:diguanylate cyclase (GGDEF)-like protein
LFKFRFSMRFTLGATILLMGVLAMVLALATGEIYRKEAVENQRAALVELLQITTGELLRDLEERARDLGQSLQSETPFRQAFSAGGTQLARELQKQFHQYFATAEVLKLEKLVAFDLDYRVRAMATAGTAKPGTGDVPCAELIDTARQRTPLERMRIQSALCLEGSLPRHVVLLPVGGLRPIGYLGVVTDPAPQLARLESRLGAPVRLRDVRDEKLYTSPDWPAPDAMHNALVAEHTLTKPDGAPALKVAILRDIRSLRNQLQQTRYLVMGLTLVATLFTVVVALMILEKTALRPLNILTEHLRRVTRDKDHLAEPVEAGGLTEIRELGEDFNQMARELDRLYDSLEHMAFTDPLTNLPNRARFRDTLEEAAAQHARLRRPFALFLMDLDRFKEVNDTLGHQIGDLLLQEVSLRLRSVLRGSDTITRLDNETIQELDNKLVARLGGDEFAAILPRVNSADNATSVAHKLLISMQEPFVIRDHPISIGISIGIALYPQHGEDIDTLMQRADAAMYFAKNNQTGLAFPDSMRQTSLI